MKTQTIIQGIKIVVMILLLTLLCCTFGGCKTKKKITKRENIEKKRSQEISVNSLEQNDIEEITKINSGSKIQKYSSDQTITAKKNNPSADPIIFEDENGNQTKVYGADEVTVSDKKEAESRQDTTSQKQSLEDRSKKELDIEGKDDEAEKKKKRGTDTKTTGTSTWLWVGVTVIILGALLLLWIFGPPRRKK